MIALSRSGLMLGCATANWSIRVFKIRKVLSNASFERPSSTLITLLSLSPTFISLLGVANMAANLPDGLSFLYSSANRRIKLASLFALRLFALSNACKKFGSLELFDKVLNNPVISTSIVTFIPPCRSRPRFNSSAFAF